MNELDSLALNIEQTSRLYLTNPITDLEIEDENGRKAYIELLGQDSPVAINHRRQMVSKQLSKRNRNKINAEELEKSSIDLLVSLTSGWLLLNFEGEEINLPFSLENARKLYTHPGLAWIKDQVDEFVSDRANFMKSSARN